MSGGFFWGERRVLRWEWEGRGILGGNGERERGWVDLLKKHLVEGRVEGKKVGL